MVGNPHRWKAVIPQLENRNSTAGCLLALLFFLPLLSKTFHISINVIALFAAIYVSIIVPIGTGIISMKDVIGKLRKLLSLVFDSRQRNYYFTQLSYVQSWVQYIYLQVEGVQTFTNQVIFSVATEKLLCPFKRFSCLFVLLFFSFLCYIVKSLKERPWTRLFNERKTSEFIKLVAAFAVLRLGKGIALGLALFTFSCQFADFEPSLAFISSTFFYFFITQYQNSSFIKDNLLKLLNNLEWQCFDGLEEYWIPVVIRFSAIWISFVIFIGLLISANNYFITGILGYFNIFLPLKHLLLPAWEALSAQKAIISKYSLASWNNNQIRGGYPCPVCLDKMRVLTARITPCGHVFHGSCLRRCLHHSKQCPMCKAAL